MKTTDETEFLNQYTRLNDAQRAAVDAVDGPVMVLAGPGTGKTQILTLRIANIVRVTDTPPDAILALTFTEAAATNMRSRLVRFMGSRAYEVTITTFHGLASKLIAQHPEKFPRILGSTIATDVDTLRIAEQVLRNHNGQRIRWYDSYSVYVHALISAIDQLKREYVTPDDLEQATLDEQMEFDRTPDLYHVRGQYAGQMKSEYKKHQERIEKNIELVSLYRAYTDLFIAERLYDFTDMLTELVRVLETDTDFRLQLQEQYQYVLVDEQQDSNNLQNRLIDLLSSFHESPNLFVVGDDKQAIYRFQGASPEHFYGFQAKYPGATVITLTDNYRSGQHILDLSHILIPAPQALSARNQAIHTTGQSWHTQLACYPTESVEAHAIAVAIRNLIDSGVEPHEIAVLYRTHGDSTDIADWLRTLSIPARVEADIDVLQTPLISQIVQLLYSVCDILNNMLVARVLYIPWLQLDSVDCARLLRSADRKRKTMIIDMLCDESQLRDCGIDSIRPFMKLGQQLKSWHSQSTQVSAPVLFDTIIRESGCYHVLSQNTLESDLSLIQVLYDHIQAFARSSTRPTLVSYVESLQTLERNKKRITQYARPGVPGFVRLMTAHKSKGLEFDHVFIPYLCDKHWGNRPNRDPIAILDRVFDSVPDNESNSDERRLLYVALTRARRQLHLSYSESNTDGREQVPSQFLSELPVELLQTIDTSNTGQAYQTAMLERYMPVAAEDVQSVRERFHSYILELFNDRPLSATHLNNFLADPWQYIFQNLVRVPALMSSSMVYGSAIHLALELAYRRVATGDGVTSSHMVQDFTNYILNQYLPADEEARLLERGSDVLPKWFAQHADTLATYGWNELDVRGVIVPGISVPLSGKLDRVEFIDGSDVFVRVIDFKTGKPKSRKDVSGENKTSDGNYFRQLMFYKLLLDYYRDGAWEMREGVIHFVEPNESGVFSQYTFEITQNDIDALLASIATMETVIRSGSYWDLEPTKKCDYPDLVRRIRG